MHSPSGSQGRISQLIREERTFDPDFDQNLPLLQLSSLYESFELGEHVLNRIHFDSEETASIDSSNPASPSSPNPFKFRPSKIQIQIPISNLRHTSLQRTSFIPDRKRKGDCILDDDVGRKRCITRSISPCHLSPRSISPMGECRSAPQSPLCRSANWEPNQPLRRPPSSKSITDRESVSSSNFSISSPSSSTSSECLIHPPKLVIPQQYQNEIRSESPNSFTPTSNETFIYPDRPFPESTDTSLTRPILRNRKRITPGRFQKSKFIRIRKSHTSNLESNSTIESTQPNSIKKRKIE